jgi:PleD family two-component response regulator
MNISSLESPTGNILIVDDHPANLRLLIEILGREGHQVRPVPSGKLALVAARGFPPDLILLDVMMSDLDGYRVCRELKSDPITREIPVIFISAIDEKLDKGEAFRVGGADYITKPFHIEEIQVKVNTYLKFGSLQKDLAAKTRQLIEVLQELTLIRELLREREPRGCPLQV